MLHSSSLARLGKHAQISAPQLVKHRVVRTGVCQARKKILDRDVSFVELYDGIRERVFQGRGLPAQDMYQLVESVKSPEQAIRCLDLIQRHLDTKAAAMQAATLDAYEVEAGTAAAMMRPAALPGTPPGSRPSLFGAGASANPGAAPAASPSSLPFAANPYANVRPAMTTNEAVGASLVGGKIPPAAGRFVAPTSNYPSSPLAGGGIYPSSPAPGAMANDPPPQGMMPQQGVPAAAVRGPMPTPLGVGAPLPSKQEMNRFLSDWHFRKRYLTRLCVISMMDLKRPEIMLRVVGSMGAYKISTYFTKELIFELGQRGAQINMLMAAAQLTTQQRGYKDKGSRAAWFAVLSLMKERGMGRDEMLPVFQALNQPPPPMAAPAGPPPSQQQQFRQPEPVGARA